MNFTGILNKNYISRLDLLIDSLKAVTADYIFFVVSLDLETAEYVKQKRDPRIKSVPIEEIETAYPELEKVKNERSFVSYLFTLSPFYPSYILQKFPELDHICSLDVDQFFFSDPSSIFNKLKDHSVLITPHRYSPDLIEQGMEEYGKYNVSFQVFKNDKVGNACLELWRKQCETWCEDQLDGERFADQKYLNTWQMTLGEEHVYSIEEKGLGLAPWNINQCNVQFKKKQVLIDNEPLILFHYQGLRILEEGFVYTSFDTYKAKANDVIRKKVLTPIIKGILKRQNFKMDEIARNRQKMDVHGIPEESKSSYFKLIKGELITFETFLKLKALKSGALDRIKNIFRK